MLMFSHLQIIQLHFVLGINLQNAGINYIFLNYFELQTLSVKTN